MRCLAVRDNAMNILHLLFKEIAFSENERVNITKYFFEEYSQLLSIVEKHVSIGF